MVHKNRRFLQIITLLIIGLSYTVNAKTKLAQESVAVQLASVYSHQNINHYLVSEKFDGIRAIWKDKQLRTRTGHIIHAPEWFTKDLPNIWLDGELWYERNNFEYVASTVSKDIPIESEWKNIKYMVFDAPDYRSSFQVRSIFYAELVHNLQLEHVRAVKQFSVANNLALHDLLESYTTKGAEGLMLHRESAMFTNGRGQNVLKLKKFMDAEALVVKHLPGKGKYLRMMGSLLVQHKTIEGDIVEFKIGSGFSDHERETPPPIGSTITFKYHGYTKRGLPRFASFMRVRTIE